MTFESTFKVLKPDNFPFHLLQIAGFDRLSTVFCFVYVLLLKWEVFLATVFEFVYVLNNSILVVKKYHTYELLH